jgi:membrane-bound serine protease (ClpP class)
MDILLDPNVAYFLLVIGFVLAVLAVVTPGTGVLEVGALFALVLAGWAVYNLPVNYWALAVLLLGVFPFLLAVRRSGRLIFLAIAILALVLGSIFLFRGEGWRPAVHPGLAGVTSALAGGFLWLIARKTLEASFSEPAHSLKPLIDSLGETRTHVHHDGSVYVRGELWSARSQEPIPPETLVRVIRREGFILDVEPVEEPTETSD